MEALFLATHFLDIKGRVRDLENILYEYENSLDEAYRRNDTAAISRASQLIEEVENSINGMKDSPYYKP